MKKQVFYLQPERPDPFLASRIIWLHTIDKIYVPSIDLVYLIGFYYFPN